MQVKVKQAVEGLTGATAAGNTALPYEAYADYLITHGYWLMSYADWLKVIGGIYMLILILKSLGFFKLCRWLWSKYR